MLGGLPHGPPVLRQSGRWTHDITQAGSSSDPEEAAMPADDLRGLQTLIHDLRRLVDEAERKLDAAQQFGHDAQAPGRTSCAAKSEMPVRPQRSSQRNE